MRLLAFCVVAVLAVQVSVVQCDDDFWYWFFGIDQSDHADTPRTAVDDFSYSEQQPDDPYDLFDETQAEESASSNEYEFVPLDDGSPGWDGSDRSESEWDYVPIDRSGVIPVDSFNAREESAKSGVTDGSQRSDGENAVETSEATAVSQGDGSGSATADGSAASTQWVPDISDTSNRVVEDASQSSSRTAETSLAETTASETSADETTASETTADETTGSSHIEDLDTSHSSSQTNAVDASQTSTNVEESIASSPVYGPVDSLDSSHSSVPLDEAHESSSTNVADGSTVTEVSHIDPQPELDALDPASPVDLTPADVDVADFDESDNAFASDDLSAEWERAFWKRFMAALMDSEGLYDDFVPVPEPDSASDERSASASVERSSESGETTDTLAIYDPETQTISWMPIDEIILGEDSGSDERPSSMENGEVARDESNSWQTNAPPLNEQIDAPLDFETTTRPMNWSETSDAAEQAELEVPEEAGGAEEAASPMDTSEPNATAEHVEPEADSNAVPAEETESAKPAATKSAEPDRMNMKSFAKKIMKAFMEAFSDP